MATDTRKAVIPDFLTRALDPQASPSEVAAAVEAFSALARRGLEGDQEAYQQSQALQYMLQAGELSTDAATEATRRWIMSYVQEIEWEFIRPLPAKEAMPRAAFRAMIEERVASFAKDVSGSTGQSADPMLRYLFHGSPDLSDLAVYIRHNWFISRSFFSLLHDLAPRVDVEDRGSLYDNLAEEAGAKPDSQVPHQVLLRRLVDHLGIDAEDSSNCTEAYALMNFRYGSVRHPGIEWGLAMLWSIEGVTSNKHKEIHRLLNEFAQPTGVREFHRIHIEADEEHSRGLLELIEQYIVSAEQQANFIASLRHHQSLRRNYAIKMWEEILALGHVPSAMRDTSPRFPLRAQVVAAGSDTRAAQPNLHLSRSGSFLASPLPLPIGTVIDVRFALAELGEASCRATVRWVRGPASGQVAGMGVDFDKISPEHEAALQGHAPAYLVLVDGAAS